MLDLQTRIARLKRPPLLARAARFGVDDYRRSIHLRRILETEQLPKHGAALIQLLEREAAMDTLRKERSVHYRPAHHVDVLIAILGEARLMRATTLQVVT